MHDFLNYLTLPFLLQGAWIAVEVAAGSLVGGLVLGFVLALIRESPIRPLRAIAWVYVWVFRGTPILLQLVFLYDVLPIIGITLPAIPTAILGFSLNEAAFMSETIRGGIHSVNATQTLAAEALGMSRLVVMRRVVLPQAMRAIIPPFGNQTIGLLKNTSLASVIAVNELTLRSEQIVAANFKFFQVFSAAAVIYLVMTTVLSIIQSALERKFDLYRVSAQTTPSAWRRLVSWGGRVRPGADHQVPDELTAAMPPQRALTEEALIARAAKAQLPRLGDVVGLNGRAMHADPEFLICKDVCKRYGPHEVLKGVSLTVGRGEVMVIIGRSGSGKSTFLRLINHLETLTAGEITLEGQHVGYRRDGDEMVAVRDVAKARADARIGIVFQQFNLFEHMTAQENVMSALLHVYGVARAEAKSRATRLLEGVGLGPYVDHLPHRLSGGQQQRVAIARALATQPRLMLLDEPTSALDPALTEEVRRVIRQLAEDGMTMVVATHDMRFAKEIADKVVFMEEGRVVESGTPEEMLLNPVQPETRAFLQLVSA